MAPRAAIGIVLLALPLAGCDPMLNVYGVLFPAWVLCIALGFVGVALLRPVFAWTRLEPHMGPLTIIYPALASAIASALWLWLFRR